MFLVRHVLWVHIATLIFYMIHEQEHNISFFPLPICIQPCQPICKLDTKTSNVSHLLAWTLHTCSHCRLEVEWNTSTVTLRVVRGDEMGLKKAAPLLKQLVTGFPPLWSGVRHRVCHVGFCGGQSGVGVGFLRVLRFPLPIFIPPIAPKIILIYHWGVYNRPKWPQYQGLIDT
jgi:hypothetical protein